MPVVENPESPLSMIRTVGGTATVPLTAKLNGFSSESLVPKLTCPLKLPAAVASSRTWNVVLAPAASVVEPKLCTTLKPVGTLIGPVNVRSCVPTLRTVNVLTIDVPGGV